MFQLAGVNVRLKGETDPSVGSELVSATTTFAMGWLVNRIVNAAWAPPSVVCKPVVGFSTNPPTSPSGATTAPSDGFTATNAGASPTAIATVNAHARAPTTRT